MSDRAKAVLMIAGWLTLCYATGCSIGMIG